MLAGLLNPLRNQTQERVDEGFVGLDSSLQLEVRSLKEKLIGVGHKSETKRTPVSLTTSTQDFDRKIATQIGAQIDHFNEPVIFVIKKNVRILNNLIEWLRSNNFDLDKLPLLLIDDEADHASINTNKEDEDPTSTNKHIRELLGLFEQSSYLGYTATPFANIFVDPDTDDEMLKDDLFPRDFIISLDAPSNYAGAVRIFEDDGDLDIVREVDDYGDILPLRHKKHEFPKTLPPSLYEALRVFILVKAARNLRGQRNSHNSMLINISRFTDIQSNIKWQVHEYLTEIRNAIRNHYALSEQEAMKNSNMMELRKTWNKEFSNTEFRWTDIQNELNTAVSPIKVIEVNASRNAEPLNYSKREYPKGRNLVAVGGLSLSRGLTLEGLTVSYFLRNSVMYDTLMQMGRWFGYRTDFEDLCRIYMSTAASSWYAHIARVTEELRNEFRCMEKAGKTPEDFGLRVRSNPDTLIVTARNKMRRAKTVFVQIDLAGKIVETAILSKNLKDINFNWNVAESLVSASKEHGKPTQFKSSHLFSMVPIKFLEAFFDDFINHPESMKTQKQPLIEYLKLLHVQENISSWDVLVLNKPESDSNIKQKLCGLPIKAQRRTVIPCQENGIAQGNRRIGSSPDESAGLDGDTMHKLKNKHGPISKIPPSIFRGMRKRPLLMLHLLDCQIVKDIPLVNKGIFAFGVSFHGDSTSRNTGKLVEYQVNTVYWRNNYVDQLGEEDEFDE
ncbi:Z1 domain protein [Candidatus Venteria ishoeyi]|uniref:Z1 domain protein n=1 Tax=Candidatus Venteria ishoeyi TaxID=1899563 RepID=A0A1H6F6L0_9GAMM|nr:Z1 domain protein [Candidatus Venteria ishoeyi]